MVSEPVRVARNASGVSPENKCVGPNDKHFILRLSQLHGLYIADLSTGDTSLFSYRYQKETIYETVSRMVPAIWAKVDRHLDFLIFHTL